mmetsp:Transcript_85182/g.219408  ORF Transcript_85182/g.219408 Transcript_85182/m.219408 type:complete len:192 (-) Transcript_85182:163-738(-)
MKAAGIEVAPRMLIVGSEDEAVNKKLTFDMAELFNHPSVRRCEVPSANGHASARALAAIAAAIVEGGALAGGRRLLSEDGVAKAQSDPVRKSMFYVDGFSFTNAGWCHWGKMRAGFVGWMGLGGSVMQWQPEARIGFGYAMNLLEPTPWNARALELQLLALRCAKATAGEDISMLREAALRDSSTVPQSKL